MNKQMTFEVRKNGKAKQKKMPKPMYLLYVTVHGRGHVMDIAGTPSPLFYLKLSRQTVCLA
jgi:hypothetical protein